MKPTFSYLAAISCAAIAAVAVSAPAAHAQRITIAPVSDAEFRGETGGTNFEGAETFVAEARAGNKAAGGDFESQIIPGGTGATRDNGAGNTGRDIAWNGTARTFSLIVNRPGGVVTFQIAGSTGSGSESRTLSGVPDTTDLFLRAFANNTNSVELSNLVFTNTETNTVLSTFQSSVTANAANSPIYLRITDIANSFSLTGSINLIGSGSRSNIAVQFKGVAVDGIVLNNVVPEPDEYVFGGALLGMLGFAMVRSGRRRRSMAASR